MTQKTVPFMRLRGMWALSPSGFPFHQEGLKYLRLTIGFLLALRKKIGGPLTLKAYIMKIKGQDAII